MHPLRGACERMDLHHTGITSLGPAKTCPVSSSCQRWRHWGHDTHEEILPLGDPATFLSFSSCSSASSTLDALAVHPHSACKTSVAPCSSGAVRINYHFIKWSALNCLGVSAEPKYSSIIIDGMIWTTVISSWSSAKLSLDFASLRICLLVPGLPAGPAKLGTSSCDKEPSILGAVMVLRFPRTTSLETKQYHYFLGISIADRGRVRIIQSGDTLSSKSTGKTCEKILLMFKWQRLTAGSKLEVTQEHGTWICLRNVIVTFETAKWKWQLLTWISLNRNRPCISC